MSDHDHSLAEQDTAVADGLCPLCLQLQLAQAREAIREAMNNLGVPQPGYPAPVAEAYRILDAALPPTEGR